MRTKKVFISDVQRLNAWIRELHTDEPDPGVIVDKILAELTPHEAISIIPMMLRDHVRRIIGRASPIDSPAGQDGIANHDVGASGGPTSRPRTSPRIAQIRDELGPELRAELARSLVVGHRQSKYLRDCTAADLRYIVNMRDQVARATAAEARHFGRILDAVEKAGVATVGKLPTATLRAVVLS